MACCSHSNWPVSAAFSIIFRIIERSRWPSNAADFPPTGNLYDRDRTLRIPEFRGFPAPGPAFSTGRPVLCRRPAQETGMPMPPAANLWSALASHPDHALALAALDRPPLAFAGLRDLIRATVERLNGLGIGPGDRVAIVLPNG